MEYSTPGNVYQQVEISTSNKLQLVVMLYDGALRSLNLAKGSIGSRDLVGKAQNLDRVLAIIGELQNTLNIEEGGEISFQLDRLYTYMAERVLEASSKLEVQPLDEVIKLLRILQSAWNEVARKEQRAGANAQAEGKSLAPSSAPASSGSRQAMELYG
jgi:flagellar protein FliS